MRTLNCGVIDDGRTDDIYKGSVPDIPLPTRLPIYDNGDEKNMPQAWVKAAQIVRSNSLASGNSGIRPQVLESFIKLLQEDLVPQVPLRGSISASGDLSPLAYIAAALQGNPGIRVWYWEKNSRKLAGAKTALEAVHMSPIHFAPKEVVAIVNGTSFSAGAAALAIHDAHNYVVLAQVLTAMAVEGLNGTSESFDPYFTEVRPHPGQAEAAGNILQFLVGSKLVRKADTQNSSGLRQDRYALRTSPQWIGPEIENLRLAHEQIVMECNSITDNPLIKPDGSIIQGGNFQAMAVTSAMDKTRMALQTIGRMLFQQFTELMNPATNNGLPSNLTANEPSCDIVMKGIDMASASYMSELAFLSHSVTPFVMVAEQGNQSLNSMALVSTRYTHTALDLFTLLSANSLVALCQALDLRAIQFHFLVQLEPIFHAEALWMRNYFHTLELYRQARDALWAQFKTEFQCDASQDCIPRFKAIVNKLRISAIAMAQDLKDIDQSSFHEELRRWIETMLVLAMQAFNEVRSTHTHLKTMPLLGKASQRIYRFLREDLDVPLLQRGDQESTAYPVFKNARLGTTLGTYTSRVYRSLKHGTLIAPVMECLRDAMRTANEQDASSSTNTEATRNDQHLGALTT